MIFSYNWLQSFFNKKLPQPEKLAELLTLHAFEVDGIEKRNGDHILNIDILPNRAHDCLSHLGVARELSAILKIKISEPRVKIVGKKNSNITKLTVKVDDPDLCFRYIGAIIRGIRVKESPKWLRDQLKVLGQKSINNIVDLTNYVMLELGQPMHVFDADKKILGRLATEIAVLLLGKHRPDYAPNKVAPVYVVVTNTNTVMLSGNKENVKTYYHHTRYAGGLKSRPIAEQRRRDSRVIIENAVSGMLPKNSLRDDRLKHLRLFTGAEHTHKAQILKDN